MSNDAFEAESQILKKAEAILLENPNEEDLYEGFKSIVANYKKLLKVSSRLVRMSDRNEKAMRMANLKIQDQQTDLKEAHQELKRLSELRLKTLVEATPIPIVISRVEDNQVIYANAIAGPILGLATDNLLGKNVTDFYQNPEDKEKLGYILKKEGKVDHYQVQFKKKDGSILWGDVSERPLVFNDEPCILSACNDVTHLKELTQAANRFVPAEYLSFLQKESLVDISLGDHVTDEMTVMFSDLRSFTTISEEMTPQENFDFVNAYLGRVSPAIREFGGFIVKYLGDGIMAIFPKTADDAVQAGIETLIQVNIYNEYRAKAGRQPIQVGIGVNTGHMMVGMVGEEGRMQGDAFSDNVNLTSRLEGLTKYYSVSFIISAATKNALADCSKYNIRFLDKVQVKGKMKALDLYEVYDADLPDMRSLKQETHEHYQQAMKHFFAKEFTEAQSLLFKVLQKNPNDKVAWHHLMSATRYLENNVADNWTGVTVMSSK